jgi:hypothetical protein
MIQPHYRAEFEREGAAAVRRKVQAGGYPAVAQTEDARAWLQE